MRKVALTLTAFVGACSLLLVNPTPAHAGPIGGNPNVDNWVEHEWCKEVGNSGKNLGSHIPFTGGAKAVTGTGSADFLAGRLSTTTPDDRREIVVWFEDPERNADVRCTWRFFPNAPIQGMRWILHESRAESKLDHSVIENGHLASSKHCFLDASGNPNTKGSSSVKDETRGGTTWINGIANGRIHRTVKWDGLKVTCDWERNEGKWIPSHFTDPTAGGKNTTVQKAHQVAPFEMKNVNKLTGWLMWIALLACLTGIFVASALWALGSKTDNANQVMVGKKGIMLCCAAAFFVGALAPFLNFLWVQAHVADQGNGGAHVTGTANQSLKQKYGCTVVQLNRDMCNRPEGAKKAV
jgi:hypothetical protein